MHRISYQLFRKVPRDVNASHERAMEVEKEIEMYHYHEIEMYQYHEVEMYQYHEIEMYHYHAIKFKNFSLHEDIMVAIHDCTLDSRRKNIIVFIPLTTL